MFGEIHRRAIGPLPDLSSLRPEAIAPPLRGRAAAVWRERAVSEFRSIQIMARFLSEVVGAGDPIDVYAGAVELVEDEIRHAELCAAVAAALGATALLPDPVELRDPAPFLSSPMPERALATAITMLGINETISTALIEDLAARCRQPAIKAVLDATLADEETHRGFGWRYIEAALDRFPAATRTDWRHLVVVTLAPHEQAVAAALAAVPPGRRLLAAWPEPELVELGLHGPERAALVIRRAIDEALAPRLRALDLLRA